MTRRFLLAALLPLTVGAVDGTCSLAFDVGIVLEGVALAETSETQTRGLSGTNDAGGGMLFTWPTAEPRAVWMRDTRVPLTIAWLDTDGRLFGVEDLKPETDDMVLSMAPAVAALELPRGMFDRVGLAAGDRLVSRDCRAE